MIRIETSNNFLENNTEFVKLLSDVTDKSLRGISDIVQKDIEVNIAYGRSIFGGALKPNKKGSRILFKSGTLFKSIRNETMRESGLKGRVIFVDSSRSQIAKWLQYGTKKMKAREFFGLGKTALSKIDSFLKNG